MRSEALRRIRTMHQIKSSLDVARGREVRTTNSLSKTREELHRLGSLTDRRQEQILAKERARFAALDQAVSKSRQRVLQSREKLAATINRNRALMELRHELQRSRWEGTDPPPSNQEHDASNDLPRMELRY